MKMVWMGILGVTLATAMVTADVAHSATTAGARSYASGRFAFGIDGQFAGFVREATGGGLAVDVTRTTSHEPLTMEIGMGMGKPMFEWIKASWDQGITPRDLSIKAGDAHHRVTSARRLEHALITEVTVPALDGSSKDPAYFTVKIDPQKIRYQRAEGTITPAEETGSKKWMASNFRLEIDGLPCSRVSKIDSLTWEHKVVRDEVGEFRKPVTPPRISDLKLTISMADYDAWAQWHRSFVIDGKSTDGDEKRGSLTFLGPDMKEELATIGFEHLGIVSLERPRTKGASTFTVNLRPRALKFSSGK